MPVPQNFRGSRVSLGPDNMDAVGFHYRQLVRRGQAPEQREQQRLKEERLLAGVHVEQTLTREVWERDRNKRNREG